MQGRADNEQARIYAELTPAERELARDWDACAWGSLDVSPEDVLARASTVGTRELGAHRAAGDGAD
jgi:hypothetical protein